MNFLHRTGDILRSHLFKTAQPEEENTLIDNPEPPVLGNFSGQDLIHDIQIKLQDIFSAIIGPKTLVVDQEMLTYLDHVITEEFYKKMQVKSQLLTSDINIENEPVICLFRPTTGNMKDIARLIRILDINAKKYSFFNIPRTTSRFNECIDNKVNHIIEECELGLIPLGKDLLSLEMKNCYRELFLHKSTRCLHDIAQALSHFQSIYGTIPKIKAAGDCSVKIAEMLCKMPLNRSDRTTSTHIDEIILFDRQIDLITPHLLQTTYQGTLDEFFKPSYIQKILKPKTLELKTDPILPEIEYLPNSELGRQLTLIAKKLESIEKADKNKMSLSELGSYTKTLFDYQRRRHSISCHTALITELYKRMENNQYNRIKDIEYSLLDSNENKIFDDFIYEQEDQSSFSGLRLLIIKSQVSGGLSKKECKTYLHHAYDREHLFTLLNLEKTGLITKKTGKKTTPFKLQKDHYTPLSVSLIKNSNKWNTEFLAPFTNQFCEKSQEIPLTQQIEDEKITVPRKPIKLVFFVGGCTRDEVAAFRLLQNKDPTCEYIIGTTEMITGNSLLKSILGTSPESKKPEPLYSKEILRQQFKNLTKEQLAAFNQALK